MLQSSRCESGPQLEGTPKTPVSLGPWGSTVKWGAARVGILGVSERL